jgi:pimeloyl-ACP methyl ester carboxylesterase
LGHGKSDPLDTNGQKATLKRKPIKEIIVSQIFTNFVLVGSSDGASIALLYAAKYQDCRAVISIAGHAKVEEGPKQELETLLKIQKIILQLEKYHSDKTVLLFQNWHNCWLSKSFNNWNIEKKLIKIKCPSLILQGEKTSMRLKNIALKLPKNRHHCDVHYC